MSLRNAATTRAIAIAMTTAFAATACGAVPSGAERAAMAVPEAAAVREPVTVQAGDAAAATPDARRPGDVSRPVRLRIPAIGVSAPVVKLALDRTGKLIAPKRFDVVGWNVAGPEPGERGTAVIAGHVDSRTGPAVFYRLGKLRKGDEIRVERADGTAVVFTVRRLARYPKNRVPNAEVYGSRGRPELRLITCGGFFDRTRRSYRDNIVVFAADAEEKR